MKKIVKMFVTVLAVLAASLLLGTTVKVSAETVKIKEIKPKKTEIVKDDNDMSWYMIKSAEGKKQTVAIMQGVLEMNFITVFKGDKATSYDMVAKVNEACGLDVFYQYYYDIKCYDNTYYVLGYCYPDGVDSLKVFGFYTKDFETITAFDVPEFENALQYYVPNILKIGKNFVFIVNQDLSKSDKKTGYYYIGTKLTKMKKKAYPSPAKLDSFKKYMKTKDVTLYCLPRSNGKILDVAYKAFSDNRPDDYGYLISTKDGKTWEGYKELTNIANFYYDTSEGAYSVLELIPFTDDTRKYVTRYIKITDDPQLANFVVDHNPAKYSGYIYSAFYKDNKPYILCDIYEGEDSIEYQALDVATQKVRTFTVPIGSDTKVEYADDYALCIRYDIAGKKLYAINIEKGTAVSMKLPKDVESVFLIGDRVILNTISEKAYAVAIKDLK